MSSRIEGRISGCVARLIFVVANFVLLVGCTTNEPQNAVITIDPGQRYQTIVGWEATAQAGQDFASFPEYRDKLLFDAVNELGINRLRLEIKSGAESTRENYDLATQGARAKRYEIVNDNDDPYLINEAGFHFDDLDRTIEQVVLPMRKLLTERNEKLVVNLNYVDFGASDFEHKDHPEEYAEFVLAVFLHMRDKYDFVPDTVEVVLEPDTDNASWTAEQLANAMVATSARLRANGFDPAFVAPSTTDAAMAIEYIDGIATVPGAMDAIVEFSYHRYSGVSHEVLHEIAERAARYGKRTSMLEWIGADQASLHEDLKLANVSAWQQYTLAYSGADDGGAYFKVDSQESDPTLTMSRRARFLRQYFRHIRPGAIRIAASTTNGSLDPVAFKNLDGSFTVVIRTSSPGTAVVSGLPSDRYSVTYATGEDSGILVQNSEPGPGEQLSVSIPSAGVLTIYSDNEPAR